VHVPFLEPDGGLARIRLPGGVLTAGGARTVAAAVDAGGGHTIELTNRANLQLRGLSTEHTAAATDLLVAAGLVDREPDVDERRNVLSSPTAGIDRDELIDVRPVVAAVLAQLAAPSARVLSPKFGVLVDGGGAVHVRHRVHDVALGALCDAAGHVTFEVRLAGALAGDDLPDPEAARWVVAPSDVAALVDAVCEVTAEHGHTRVRALLDVADEATVWGELADRTKGALVERPAHELVISARVSESPVGIRAQRQPDVVSVGTTVPLGRIDATTLRAVADLADEFAANELRVSPWRQLLVVGVARADASRLARALEDLGLVTDPTHPAGSVVACVGARGCASGHTDTLADAAALVEGLAGKPVGARPFTVHVSGCEKGCASPDPTDLALVGTVGGTYALHRRAQPSSAADTVDARFGRRIRTAVQPATILDAVRETTYLQDGAEIYRASFAIIRAEADLRRVPADLEPAAVRMVHACGMVDLVEDLDWSPGVGTAIRRALANGATILTDSMMLADGITRARLPAGNEVRCTLRDDDVAARAAALDTTRSAAAVDAWVPHLEGAVVSIGNAPTALFRLLELLDGGAPHPAAIVGVPVGFVGAAEAKRALSGTTTGVPWLTVHGRRGGSAIAAAAINALASAPE
jgi:precorrin-3B synthase